MTRSRRFTLGPKAPGSAGAARSGLMAGAPVRGSNSSGGARLPTKPLIALLAFLHCFAGAFAQQRIEKPRVPPGVDPGGVAIAIIGSGIDYTRPEIAARLARDGEGEIIGWDFLDNDRRPFEACAQGTISDPCALLPGGAAPAMQPHRFIALRASVTQPQSLVAAVQTASKTPARIVVIALPQAPPLAFVLEAANRHPQLYFVAVVDVGSMEPKQRAFVDENYVVIASKANDARNAQMNMLATVTASTAAHLVSMKPQIGNDELRRTVGLAIEKSAQP